MGRSAFPSDDKFEDGIYFGLPEDIYHRLPWCGSSDIKLLASSPPDYWFKSPMNPLRVYRDEETPAKIFGTAIHHAILYGIESFERKYQTIEGDDGKEAVSAAGLKKWLEEQGAKSAKLKADNERMIIEEFGIRFLTVDAWTQIMLSAKAITSNPYLKAAFSGGWSEVSIFWHEENVPCKCRIDYLKLKASVDLKSFRGKDRNMSIDRMVLNDIFNYGYHTQSAHYSDGRVHAKELLAKGRVFAAGDRPDDAWLKPVLDNPEPAWVFVFYKADGAPVSKSYQDTFNGAMVGAGRAVKRVALTNYQNYHATFGTDVWVNTDPPYNIDGEDLPKWL